MRIHCSNKTFTFVAVFLASFAICIAVTTAYIKDKCQLEYLQMDHLASIKSTKVSSVLTKLLYKTQTLAALVIQNNGEIKKFEQVAATIIDDPSIRNVILAPDGIVSHVYPLESNEQSLGLNYFSGGAGNNEAILAKQTGQLVLGGPFELVQGGQALVGRFPVYIKNNNNQNKFWGIVSVTLNYPLALEGAELEQLKNQGFAYEIWRINPDNNERQVIASSKYKYNKHSNYIEHHMNMLNAEWYFRLSPIREWYQHPETWIYSLSGLLISLLVAFLVVHNRDLRAMKSELEQLTFKDPLTGIFNRRGLFMMLDLLLSVHDSKFILCYMDLNKFKDINDTFGHHAGDNLLRHFVKTINKNSNEDQLLARIGGDEFILIFKNTSDVKETEAFFKKVHDELKSTPIISHSKVINISFSVGFAVYPDNSTNIDELIALADSAMYKSKKAE